MLVQRWNYDKHNYDEVENKYETPLYVDNMETLIKCINCGKEVEFGDTYTSLEYHSYIGLGYPVCEECYQKEWHRREYSE